MGKMENGRLNEIVEDYCYSRHICDEIGVNYNNLTAEDLEKIRRYIENAYQTEHESNRQTK